MAAGDRAHTSSIGAFVAVKGTLVVAGWGKDLIAVIHDGREDGDLRADQALLDQHAAVTKSLLGKDFVEECHGAGLVGAHGHSFACGETVELEHGGVFAGDGGHRFLKRFGGGGAGGGNAVADEELFGELLAGLKLSRLLRRTPARDVSFLAEVGEAFAFDEVALLAGNAQVDIVATHPLDQALEAIGFNRLGDLKNRITTGKAEQLGLRERPRQRVHQSMFTPSFAYDQNFH